MKLRAVAAILLLVFTFAPVVAAKSAPGSARALYNRTLEREQQLRALEQEATAKQIHTIVAAYDAIVRRFPASGYSDNALWQGGNLALLAFERFGDAADRRTAERLLRRLKSEYPTSTFARRVDEALGASVLAEGALPARSSRGEIAAAANEGDSERPAATSGVEPQTDSQTSPSPAVMIREIKRTRIPEGMRVTIEMDAETSFHAERLENPRRVFFDLKGTRPVPSLRDARLQFDDEIVREIRLGRHPQTTTRIVFDMNGVDSYSVFTLYSPYRLVIDFKPLATASSATPASTAESVVRKSTSQDKKLSDTRGTAGSHRADGVSNGANGNGSVVGDSGAPPSSVPSLAATPLSVSAAVIPVEAPPAPPARPSAAKPTIVTSPIPTLPSANSDGKFSLSRQLGLGISRVVIDAGHGGHDPGAQSNGVSESELTLDVALRLSRLLEKQPGVEVVLTRDTDVFIPLEERTAIANREGADLFLSIHANASRNPKARGVESYFLNFASNAAAEAVAARENAASSRAMHSLPEIVRAIALNDKIDESRDFAEMVQRSMVRRLSARNTQVRDLGVKQAPFVVLIGAAMPSVLAEISFVTNKQEGQLLKSTAYRQQIAESLLDAVLRYQQSLKRPRAGVIGLGTR
jgi:N-acetylmuramoyl-L-alanine amidase